MEIGEDVQEVYDLFLKIVESQTFPDMPQPDIYDLNKAADLASTQFDDEKKLIWQDVISSQSSNLLKLSYTNETTRNLYNIITQMYIDVVTSFYTRARETGRYTGSDIHELNKEERLRGSNLSVMDEYTHSDLLSIMHARAFQGRTNVFYEKLYDAYKQGGWPCYWEGPIPEGRPLVYSHLQL